MATASETSPVGASIAAIIRWLAVLLLAVTGFLATLVILFVVGSFAYTRTVPAYVANYYVASIRTDVRLEFWWLWDLFWNPEDSGRYLRITSPSGRKTFNMCGGDWANWSRTSLYLTENNGLAVIGVQDCDYIVAVDSLKVTNAWRVPSDKWTYLGAFQIVSALDKKTRQLRFIDASEQSECIEMVGSTFPPAGPRKSAHSDRCPPPAPQQ